MCILVGLPQMLPFYFRYKHVVLCLCTHVIIAYCHNVVLCYCYYASKLQAVLYNLLAAACHLPESEQPPPSKRAKVEPLSEDMQTYASYLKSVYTKPGTINYDKWPPVKSRKFINLVLIGKESEDKQEAERLKKATIHGNIDDILADSKAPINLAGVACNVEDGSLPKCIVVEGAPGVGKSTFAWELCGKWGKGEMLQQYKLVVLLRLREKKARKAKTVEDLFTFYDSEVQQAVVKEIKRTGGKGVLLLLEGYDELPVKERSEDSFFMSVIKGDELPEATILVTSRHSASGTLHRCHKCRRQISQHVEIIGFTKDNINAYLETSASGDSEFLSGIKKYLECYPHIHSMMYIPLNSAIVVEVYRNCKKDSTLVPKTMTELYFSLIRSLLLRYLKEHPEYSKQQWNIRSFLDLPPKVYKQLFEVARIAYEGYFNSQQVIFSDLPADFDSLGLMQCVPELYVDQGTVVSYNFLHMTVQEFLTAFHMSRLSIAEKINIFSKLMSNNRCNVVLRFLAGLTKFSLIPDESKKRIIFGKESEDLKSEALHLIFETQEDISRLLSIVSEDNCLNFSGEVDPFDAYVLGYCMLHCDCMWKQITLRFRDIYTLNMLVHGANEQGSNSSYNISKVRLEYTHDAFAQLPLLSQFLFEEMTLTKFKIDDHFLALFNSSSLTNLTLEKCDITEAGWKALFQATTLKILYLMLVKVEGIQYLQNNVSLEDLVIDGCEISHAQIQCLATILQDNTTLEGQGIWQSRDREQNAIGDEGPVVPSTVLYHNTSLKSLVLFESSIGPHGVACLAAGLTYNSTVESLNLSMIHFGTPHPSTNPAETPLKLPQDESNCNEGITCLAEMLSLNKSLSTLLLMYCELSPSDIQQLCNALCQNQTLTHLGLSGNSIGSDHPDALCLELSHCISEGIAGLANMLSQNTSLKHLELSECCISSNEAHHLANALCHNQTLETLDLEENPIGTPLAESDDGSLNSEPDSHDESDCIGKGVIGFANLLSVNTCMKKLNLRCCCIKPSEAQHLAISLCQNEALEFLDLGHNDFVGHNDSVANAVGDEGATALASMLTVNKTLQALYLSDNAIGDEGATALASMLTVNKTLQTLYLGLNDIGVEGATALASMLTVNKTLQELNLSDNAVGGDEGATAMASMLTVNKTLKVLYLRSNSITMSGTLKLIDSLTHNTTIEKLSLYVDKELRSSNETYMRVKHRIQLIKTQPSIWNA